MQERARGRRGPAPFDALLGVPEGPLQALRHAVATPMRQYFESVKTKVNLAHRATPAIRYALVLAANHLLSGVTPSR